jgi:hypothetical protein
MGTARIVFWLVAIPVLVTLIVFAVSDSARRRSALELARSRQDDARAIATTLAAVPWAARADSIDGRIAGRAAQWSVHGTQGDAVTSARVFELGRGRLAFGDSLVRPLRIDELLDQGDHGHAERVYYLDHTRPRDADLALVREKAIRARTAGAADPGYDTLRVEVLFDDAGGVVTSRKSVNGIAVALTPDDVHSLRANHLRVRGMFH